MKIPLIEYLDKLEATAKFDTTYCDTPGQCPEHDRLAATLSLIAKLREASRLIAALDRGNECTSFNEIEVPE